VFLAANEEILDNASDSLSGGSNANGVVMRMLGGTVEEIREGREGKERDWSMS
jgi:hypothetical protein